MLPVRIGLGYDSHVFESGRRLVLGGVEIAGCDGLKAHSDGDAVIHALIDALLGAAALGDIGRHFPDTSEEWRGADSRRLLERAMVLVAGAGYAFGNADITVVCEKPRLAPHVAAIRSSLASLLRTDECNISVKGKTNEKMDDIGAGCGIAVYAVACISRVRQTTEDVPKP